MTETQQRWPLSAYELAIVAEERRFAAAAADNHAETVRREVYDAIWALLEERGMKRRKYLAYAHSAPDQAVEEVASWAGQEVPSGSKRRRRQFDAWEKALEATPPEQRDIRADVQARRWEQL